MAVYQCQIKKKNIGERIFPLDAKYASMVIGNTLIEGRNDEGDELAAKDMDNAQDNKDRTAGTEEAGEDINTECPVCSLEVSVNENAQCDLEHLKNEALEFICPGCSLRWYENNDDQAPTNVCPSIQRPTDTHPHRQPTDTLHPSKRRVTITQTPKNYSKRTCHKRERDLKKWESVLCACSENSIKALEELLAAGERTETRT